MATRIPDNHAEFTLGAIAEACDGRISPEHGSTVIRGVVTDSRRVAPGNLFVALRGEHHDAHEYLSDVAARGATAALVQAGTPCPGGLVAVEVDDTLRALGDLAAAHRRGWPGRLVAITGSAGKTTTKELVAAALATLTGEVISTRGNLNNLIGVPMTLFCLEPGAELAVVEMGTNAPGEIRRLTDIARPHVGVVTSVAVAHTEGLGSLDDVAAEKTSLLEGLEADGVPIHHADSVPLRTWAARRRPGLGISFGRGADSDVRLTNVTITPRLHSRCRFELRDQVIELDLSLLGTAPAIDAGAALAVVIALYGADRCREVVAALEQVQPTAGRLAPRWVRDAVVIDDTYNSNPASATASIDTAVAAADATGGRALLVLGDMKELGSHSIAEHARLGIHAVAQGVALLICCGAEMKAAADAASRHDGGSKASAVMHVDDPVDAVELLRDALRPRDVALVKGSRSMQMERVVEAVAA